MNVFLRRHRRSILVFILLFVGVPMIFYVSGTGGLGPDQAAMGPQVVAQVGNTPISSQAFYEQYRQVANARAVNGEPPTPEQLMADGTVDQILEMLINEALIRMQVEERDLKFSREFLQEQMRNDSYFQNEDGTFNARLWNQWVDANRGMNWDEFYESMNAQISRNIYLDLMAASARVLDADLREEFTKSNTKIRVKHVAIQPPVELTEEEIQAHYEQNKEQYMAPAQRVAEFVAISLEPERPALLDELVTRARSGEDFATLATENSQGATAATGGDLGWIIETAALPEHQQALFQMEVGAVSDPIKGPNSAWYIYNVYEDRVSDIAGKRDVRVREIVLRPTLDETERQTRLDKAQETVVAAKQAGDLAQSASDAGLELKRTSTYSTETTEIENVDSSDALVFRLQTDTLLLNDISEVIPARNNAYVAKIVEYVEPVQRTLEEAREDVVLDAESARKQSPEYRAEVELYSAEIAEKAKSLEDIKTLFPDLSIEIKETEPFSQSDFLFQQGIFWQPREVIAAFEGKGPGAIAGPIVDFQQQTHFMELVERIEPDEALWATQWPLEEEQLRTAKLNQLTYERQADFLQHLREQAAGEFMIQPNYDAIAEVIGLETSAPETPATEPSSPAGLTIEESTAAPAPTPEESAEPIVVEATSEPADAAEPAPAPAAEEQPAPEESSATADADAEEEIQPE